MRFTALTLSIMICATSLVAQDGWKQEGSLEKWTGPAITSSELGCQGAGGDPVVEHGSTIREIKLEGNVSTTKEKPGEGSWVFLPRVPNVVANVVHSIEGGGATIVKFHDVWMNSQIADVTIMGSTDVLGLDVTDTWIAADGTQGCIVFSPTASTPEGSEEYVIAFFSNNSVTFQHRVKPKVDLDLYVRPHDEHGVVAYVRGNGISFPPSEEELFTNAGYLVYQPDGTRETLSLASRGPGSGKGRRIVWHSNKWDRLLLVDEFASGAILVKASNGILVDSITTSSVDPGSVKILSASGNNNDKWMATHANVGSKNVLILWAMPDTREVASIDFGSSDGASKQMPLSPWNIVIPFISTSGSTNTLYSWNSQDVVSVDETGDPSQDPIREHRNCKRLASVYPNPAQSEMTVKIDDLQGAVRYVIVNESGTSVYRGEGVVNAQTLSITVSGLEQGSYSLMVTGTPLEANTRRIRPTRARFVISR